MGGGWFPKLVWPKHNMINQQVKVGVANNERAKCWCGMGKVGVATATPAIRHSPPMPVGIVPNFPVAVGNVAPRQVIFQSHSKF